MRLLACIVLHMHLRFYLIMRLICYTSSTQASFLRLCGRHTDTVNCMNVFKAPVITSKVNSAYREHIAWAHEIY